MSSSSAGAQHPPPASVGSPSNCPEPPQTPDSGSTSSTRDGRLEVAVDGGDDAAGLLEAGQGEERRRPAVGLHPGQVEPHLRLGELGGAVRVDRAARVHVGVDERGQLRRRRQHRVEVEADLARAPCRSGRKPVTTITSSTSSTPRAVDADQGQLAVGRRGPLWCGRTMTTSTGPVSTTDARALAEGATGLELVVVAAAERVAGLAAAYQPRDSSWRGRRVASAARPTRVFCAEAPVPATATCLPA